MLVAVGTCAFAATSARADNIFLLTGASTTTVSAATADVAQGTSALEPVGGSLDLGQEAVGASSPTGQIELQNTGSAPVTFGGSEADGADPTEFAIGSTACTTIQPSATCELGVSLSPATTGTRTASLEILDSSGTGSSPVTLTGTGTAPVIPPVAPVAPISPGPTANPAPQAAIAKLVLVAYQARASRTRVSLDYALTASVSGQRAVTSTIRSRSDLFAGRQACTGWVSALTNSSS